MIGAHLSGMPLNHQLTTLGARFLRTVPTRRDYHLFALPERPPRPGMLRTAEGAGVAIETEVWALSAEGFGRFIAAVEAPLSIGTVRLADGTAPMGFLCEAVATRNAQDISSCGGWRRFVQPAAA